MGSHEFQSNELCTVGDLVLADLSLLEGCLRVPLISPPGYSLPILDYHSSIFRL